MFSGELPSAKRIDRCLAFTFVQPVAEPVEDAALFAGGNQTYGSTLHRRSVVDVVFKNEDLQQEEERMESKYLPPQTADWHTCSRVSVFTPDKVVLIYDETENPREHVWTLMLSFAHLRGFGR